MIFSTACMNTAFVKDKCLILKKFFYVPDFMPQKRVIEGVFLVCYKMIRIFL